VVWLAARAALHTGFIPSLSCTTTAGHKKALRIGSKFGCYAVVWLQCIHGQHVVVWPFEVLRLLQDRRGMIWCSYVLVMFHFWVQPISNALCKLCTSRLTGKDMAMSLPWHHSLAKCLEPRHHGLANCSARPFLSACHDCPTAIQQRSYSCRCYAALQHAVCVSGRVVLVCRSGVCRCILAMHLLHCWIVGCVLCCPGPLCSVPDSVYCMTDCSSTPVITGLVRAGCRSVASFKSEVPFACYAWQVLA
jgi:hypothetical protein